MVEMLLQSQWTEERDGNVVRVISLLPALPKEWAGGSVKGLCARDGFVLDFAWDEDELKHVVVHSKLGRACVLRCGGREVVLKTEAGKDYSLDGGLKPVVPGVK
jgi:alpha-L-fucosidase 2